MSQSDVAQNGELVWHEGKATNADVLNQRQKEKKDIVKENHANTKTHTSKQTQANKE